ncbi:MAG: autotransporter-associated beta strand repeat-containing protein [Luteolibacter sp.]
MKSKYNPFLSVQFNSTGLIRYAALSLGLGLAGLSMQSAQAADKTWTGTTDQTWDTGTNWGGTTPVNADRLLLNTSTGNFPIITATNAAVFKPGDVALGTATANTGRLDLRSGTLTMNVIGTTGNWCFVGGAVGNTVGGTGTLNIADTSVTGQSNLTAFGQGSGGLTIGKLWVGGRDNNNGTGTVNINTTGTISAQSTGSGNTASVIVGSNAGSTGTLKIDSGTLNTAADIWVANNGGTGAVSMAGGTITATGNLFVGRISGSGSFTLSGGTVTAGSVQMGVSTAAANTETGTVTVNGGTLTSTNDMFVGVGGTAAAKGTLVIGGGTVNAGTTAEKWLKVGAFDAVTSELDINTGTLNLNSGTDIRFSTNGGGGTNVINQNGGNVASYSDNGITPGGNTVLDFQQASAAAANNSYNLNGGTLAISQVTSNQTNGTRAFNFNGGTLKVASAINAAAFFNLGAGNARANVRDGGATIDTNGFDVTIAQTLLHSNITTNNPITGTPDAAVDGGLKKQSTGTLTLSGVSTYTGPTLVSGGTLNLTGSADINTSSAVTINGSGAKLVQANFGTISSPVTLTQGVLDGNGTINSLTVANAVGNTLSAGNGTSGLLNVGTLTFQGAATVNVTATGISMDRNFQVSALTTNAAGQVVVNATNSSGFWSPGDYPVISYSTSFSGSISNFVLGTIPGLVTGQQTATLVNTGSAIVVRIVGGSLTWTGKQNSNWTTGTVGGLKNWADPSTTPATAAEFTNGNPVLFDDSALNFSVNFASNVSPTSTIFDNNNYYTLSSATFGITGGSILKSNSGTVVFTNTNTTTGAVTINGGVLQLGDGATDGSIAASSSITNNASLLFLTTGTQTITNPIGGTGVTTMNGTGTLTLAGANTFTGGGMELLSGTLNLNHASAIGGTTAGSLAISGGILNNTSGAAITTTTAKAQTWNGDFTFAGSNNLDFNSGVVTLSGGGAPIVNVAAGILTTGSFTSSGTGLSLTGSGILAITSGTPSNIAGNLDVAAGAKLRINTGAATGTTNDFIATGLTGNGTVENGGGVERWLFVNTASDEAFGGLLQNGAAGALGLNKGAAGILTLTGTNTYTGHTIITAGTLSISTLTNGGVASPIGAASNVSDSLNIGFNAGTGTLLYTGSDVTTDRGFTIGANGGNSGVIDTNANMTFTGIATAINAGGFVKRGTGTLTLSNSSTAQKLSNGANGGTGVLSANVALGKLALKNGTFTTGGEIVVGGQLQTAGVYTAASLDVTNGGTLTVANWVSIGRGNGTTGLSSVLTVDGGTLSQTAAASGLAMGYDAVITGFNAAPVLIAKGASTVNIAGILNVGESVGSEASIIIQDTSVLNLTNATLANKSVGVAGKGTLTLTAGAINSGTGLTVAKSAGGVGVINLNGGLLDTATLIGGLGTSTLHFNGGTLRANVAGTTFLQGLTAANVDAGGAAIDTQAFNVTIAQPLSAGIGTAGLTKSGAGNLTLSGVNTYVGSTTVNAGTLTLADNAGLKFVIAANGVANKITGAGTATLDGDFTLDLTAAAIANGNSWTLVDTTTKSFTANFTVAGGFTEVSNVWTKVDGNNTWTFTEATGVLSLQVASSGFGGWITGFGLAVADQDPTDDPDGDGINNLMEYVLGGNPSTTDGSIKPTGSKVGTDYVFTFKRSDLSEADTTQTVEYGNDLTVWGSYTIGASPGVSPVSIVEDSPTADLDTVTVTIPTASATKFFARLKVVK